jgi:hypothetical protein
MTSGCERGALLGQLYQLDDGSRVRLRLARGSDLPAIIELAQREEFELDRLQIARLVHFDPRRRFVVCATGLVDSAETLLGIGAIALDGDRSALPEILIVEQRYREELGQLLTSALIGAAHASSRSRAA